MNLRPAAPRVLLRALMGLAACGGLSIVGCSSEVGTSPSSREKMKDLYAAGGQSQLVRGRTRKGIVGPSNIKKRLFTAAPDKPRPEQ